MQDNKKIVVFYYEGFAEFEISLALLYLSTNEMISVAMEKKEYKSLSGQRFVVDHLIDEINPMDVKLLIIPGGDPKPYLGNQKLYEFIQKASSAGAVIAGICGGVDILVSLGFLEGKSCTGNADDPSNPQSLKDQYARTNYLEDGVVVDRNFITAKGEAFIEFASILPKQIGMKADEYFEFKFK
ncbi:MAG: DJ-1/PfpI family protein [Acholeplasmataceae bacterium]|nr:DJ-1/PfpI family protein [Acholeplasmataceae bacterium]